MRLALSEARKGVGLTSPNPPVGAIIVKEGAELGRGYHRICGGPHAEREAIAAAKQKHGNHCLQGAAIYVTLEPCSTKGRTGACTDAIIAEGFQRVIYGAEDPNPAHAGAADKILAARGIEVSGRVAQKECTALIRPFAKVQQTGRPWVIVKTAMTLDGSITRPAGEGQWLSNPESRAEVQQLRVEADAILTTGETVRKDDARLTLRGEHIPPEKKQPWRVILTKDPESIPKTAQVKTDAHADRTIFPSPQSMDQILRKLVDNKQVNTVLVEAGGDLVGQLVDEGLVDEMVVYLAPLLASGPVPAVGGEGVSNLSERWKLSDVSYQKIGSDVCLRGIISGRGGELER